MDTNHEVIICDEITEKKIPASARELLTVGRKLADSLHQPLSALLIGKLSKETAEEIIRLGADKVYIFDPLDLPGRHPDVFLAILVKACHQITPSIILLSQTDLGRDAAPRLAARLRTSVVLDCKDLAIDPEKKQLLQTKPVYGGKAVAVFASNNDRPQIATLRPKSAMAAEPQAARKGEIITLNFPEGDLVVRSKLLETAKQEMTGAKLEEAKIVVAGGGGIGSREGFKLLEELAEVLGGTVAVTRVPCDEGWMPISLEIGQTGHIVKPDLYIAVGISGALQHMAGCAGSKCIVAINKDPEAHIFQEADFGVVGDYKEVLKPLIEKCRVLCK